MSPLQSLHPIHHYGYFLDFPTRKHAIALTLILTSFISIQFKLSNNQAKLSKQSLTAYVAIRIVFLTLQRCTITHTCHHLPPFACHCSRGDSEDATTTLHPQLRSSPQSRLFEGDPYGSPAEVPVQPQMMCAGSQAGLSSRSATSQTVPQPYQNSELLRLLGFERGEVLG